jgi:hypothetical protein
MQLIPQFVRKTVSDLRYPYLFIALLILTAINFFIPDPIPFIDEAILLISSAIVGKIRKKKEHKNTTK